MTTLQAFLQVGRSTLWELAMIRQQAENLGLADHDRRYQALILDPSEDAWADLVKETVHGFCHEAGLFGIRVGVATDPIEAADAVGGIANAGSAPSPASC